MTGIWSNRTIPALGLAGLMIAATMGRAAEDCGPLPDVLGETADKAQIHCALSQSRASSMTRSISIVETDPQLEAVRFAVNFDFASTDLTAASQALLSRVAAVIAEDPALRQAGYFVDGHTDAVGSEAANMALGTARADSVATHLAGAVEFPLTLKMRSFGETRLLDADTPQAARNRRVEITPVALE